MKLDFYVSPNGSYGVKAPSTLGNGQNFGSYGASTCVILLLTKTDGDLFCGHMSCGLKGIDENKARIKNRVSELLDSALGSSNKGQSWRVTSQSNDPSTRWIKEEMGIWFGTPAEEDRNDCNDGYFAKENDAIAVKLGNDVGGGEIEVKSGDFCIA